MKLSVVVKSSSRQAPLIDKSNPEWIIHVRPAARAGQANQAAAELIAQTLGVPKTHVHLLRGAKSKRKVFEIT